MDGCDGMPAMPEARGGRFGNKTVARTVPLLWRALASIEASCVLARPLPYIHCT